MLILSSSPQAAVILQQVSSSFDTQYDTNPLLREDSQSIWRYTITPRYKLSAVDDQNTWYGNTGLAFQRSSDKRITRDRQDPSFDTGWIREYEKGQFSLSAHYDKRSSRLAEFEQNGLVDGDGSAINKSLKANWSRSITERLVSSLGLQYVKTTYDSSRFSDSVSKNINSSLTYELTERISPFVQIGYTDFKSDGIATNNGLIISNNGFFVNNNISGGNSKSKNVSVGGTVLLSPLWTLTSSIGLNKVDSSNQNANALLGSASGSGNIGNLSLIRTGERSNFNAQLLRTVQASGIGGFVKSDQMNLSYNYQLSDRSTFATSYNVNKNKSNFDSESTQISASFVEQLSELWQMRLSLNNRKQKNFNQDVSGNVIGLTFTYNTPEF